jgi:hypothetical protein
VESTALGIGSPVPVSVSVSVSTNGPATTDRNPLTLEQVTVVRAHVYSTKSFSPSTFDGWYQDQKRQHVVNEKALKEANRAEARAEKKMKFHLNDITFIGTVSVSVSVSSKGKSGTDAEGWESRKD